MKNKKLIAVALIVCTKASSCNDWLDVTPQAQVNADKLFSTPEGYESAVYGIYTFQRYIRGRIAIFKMYIGKLYYFKLTVFIKLQLALLSHTESS